MNMPEIAVQLMNAISEQNWAALEELCAEDMQAEWVGSFTLKGRPAFVRLYRYEQAKCYSDFRSEVVERLVHDDERMCFIGRVSGTQTGPIVTHNNEYPATGRGFSAEFLCYLKADKGKIIKIVYGYNPSAIFAQLGHVSPL